MTDYTVKPIRLDAFKNVMHSTAARLTGMKFLSSAQAGTLKEYTDAAFVAERLEVRNRAIEEFNMLARIAAPIDSAGLHQFLTCMHQQPIQMGQMYIGVPIDRDQPSNTLDQSVTILLIGTATETLALEVAHTLGFDTLPYIRVGDHYRPQSAVLAMLKSEGLTVGELLTGQRIGRLISILNTPSQSEAT